MREILLRGKRTDNSEWVYGYYVSAATRECILQSLGCLWNDVIPETIGQFTGLTDKNGKKIFEGDIVECFSSDYVGRPKIDTVIVGDMTDYNTMVYLNCSNELEIIGNIHNNPELLKGGADNG